MNRLGCVLGASLCLLAVAACDSGGGGDTVGSETPKQSQLPNIEVKLPPPPSFQKDHPPETYPDATHSVYGLRKDLKDKLNQQVRVKGFIIEIYECPECPKGTACKPCRKPHFWLADRVNGAKDKALMITDYPTGRRRGGDKLDLKVGAQFIVTGTFSKTSGTGFTASNGLLVFSEAQPVQVAD